MDPPGGKVTLTYAGSLPRHLRNAHQDSLLYCHTCCLEFSNLWLLNKHIGTHALNGSEGSHRTLADLGIPTQWSVELKDPLNNLSVNVLNDHTYNSYRVDTRNDHTYCLVASPDPNPDLVPLGAVGGGIKQEKEEDVEPWGGGAPLADPDWAELSLDIVTKEEIKTEISDETQGHLGERPDETEVGGSASTTQTISDQDAEEEEEEQQEEEQSDTNSSSSGSGVDSDFRPDDDSTTADTESASEASSGGSRPKTMPRPYPHKPKTKCGRCGGLFLNLHLHARRCVIASDLPDFTPKSAAPTPLGRPPSAVRPNQCAVCLGGPYMNMDWHLKRCIYLKVAPVQCPICTNFFMNQKAMEEHKAQDHQPLVPDPPPRTVSTVPAPVRNAQNEPQPRTSVSTFPAPAPVMSQGIVTTSTGSSQPEKCVYCGSGPFFSMQHHVKNCIRRTLLKCPLCAGLFPSDEAIMDHFVRIHKATAVRPAGELPGVLLPANANSNMGSVVFFNPGATTQTAAPAPAASQSQLNSMPAFRSFLQSQGAPPFVPSHIRGPVVLPPRAAKPLSPALVPVSVSGSTLRTLTLHYSGPVSAATTIATTAPTQTRVLATPPLPAPPARLTISCMFENRSRELALQKRLKMGWRSKRVYRCRQCGAASRQPSLAVRHRYLHRGPRPHRCHCGRTFRRPLYLLRHCVAHAEATSYICAACGESFAGAQQLASHAAGTLRRPRLKGDRRYLRPLKKCRAELLSCQCGKTFRRPSAYLWHQLQNRTIARL